MWEPSLLAIQATRFSCKTVSSFIASKLGSHIFRVVHSIGPHAHSSTLIWVP